MAPSLNQFRYFCAVAETGHFGRAARRLNMSQPPLSRQIGALEEDLGAELFERTPKGVLLTPAGRQFLAEARNILLLIEQARRNTSAAGRGDMGELTVGFTMCAAYSVVPILTRLYMAAFPKVTLRMRELMPNALERDLKEGVIDLAITFPGSEAPDLQTQALLREPLNVVLPHDHRLARARRLKISDLAGERFLIVPRDQAPSLHDSIVLRCQAAGFTPTIGLEVYLQQTIVNFVAEGLGVAFVPASMRRSQIKGAVFKQVPDPPMVDQVVVRMPVNRNPCIPGFLTTAAGLTAVGVQAKTAAADLQLRSSR
jgi:DNA-binding transcriptional LysR family regulator